MGYQGLFKPNGQRFWGQGWQGLFKPNGSSFLALPDKFNPNGLTEFQLSPKWAGSLRRRIFEFKPNIGFGVFKPNGSSFSRFRRRGAQGGGGEGEVNLPH